MKYRQMKYRNTIIINYKGYNSQMEFFEQSLMIEMIQNFDFKRSQRFNHDPECINYLIEYIQTNMTYINYKNLTLIENLIQHYKFPILICFEDIYRTADSIQICMYKKEFQKILYLVQRLTKEIQFKEINFFSFQGHVKSVQFIPYKNPANFTSNDQIFLAFAHKISKIVHKTNELQILTNKMKYKACNRICLNDLEYEMRAYKSQFQTTAKQTNFKYVGLMILQNNYLKKMKQKLDRAENKILQNLELMSNDNIQLGYREIFDYQEDYLSQIEYDSIEYNQNYIQQEQYYFPNEQVQGYYESKSQSENYQNRLQYSQNDDDEPMSFKQINQKKLPKQLKKKEQLCCIQCFDYGERINEKNLQSISCIDVKFNKIYQNSTTTLLLREVCSLLNTNGGVILLGVKKNHTDNYSNAVGFILTEDQKQELFSHFKYVFSLIQPSLPFRKFYSINFVPVKKSNENQQFNQSSKQDVQLQEGLYLIRIRVKYGERNEIYSFKSGQKDCFFKRNMQGCYQVGIRDVLQLAKSIEQKPLEIPKPIHEGECKMPLKGNYIFIKNQRMDNHNQFIKREQKKKKKNNQKEEKNWKKRQYYQVSVFGIANDFLISGIPFKQLQRAFYRHNLDKLLSVRQLNESVTYVGISNSENIKKIKSVMKCLRDYVGPQHKRLKVTPISKNISISYQFYIEEVYEVLINLGFVFYCYQKSKNIIRFEQTLSAGIAFMKLKQLDINCEFVVNQ